MSAELAALVADAAGGRATGSRAVAGGDVNRALRVELADGRRLFVKHGVAGGHAMYAAEAAGLAWLGEAAALPVPAVVAVGPDAGPPFLALEWLDLGRPGPGHDEALGRGLAALHRAGAPRFGRDGEGFIGPLPVPNDPAPTWAAFYGERRLLPLARRAVEDGRLGPDAVARVESLCARLPGLLGPEEPPARLHGDLWAGNAVALADGGPALVDPAAYGGHREIDLAMMRLFGGFSERVHAAYAEAHPLAPGWEERVELMQLLPLLVHVVLFGGAYAGSFARVLARHS